MLSLFKDIYVINLRRDRVKWQHIKEHLATEIPGFRVHRFEAVNGKELSDREIKKYTSSFCNDFCPRNVLGCALSHRALWQKVVDDGLESICILEDDITVSKDFEQILQLASFEVPEQWDIIYLGCRGACDARKEYNILEKVWSILGQKGHRVSKHLFIPDHPAGTYGYCVSQRGAQKLLEYTREINFHIDVQIGMNIKTLNAYAIEPKIVYTSTDDSTLVTKRPFLFNDIFKTFKLRDGTTLAWLMAEPLIEVYGMTISIWHVLYILFGFLVTRVGVPRAKSMLTFITYLIADEVYGYAFHEDVDVDIYVPGLHLLLFIAGTLF